MASAFVLEGRNRRHRTEDFFLENAHFVVTFDERRLDVKAVFNAFVFLRFAAAQNFRAFVFADLDVVQDFFVLVFARLCADHRFGIERMSHFDRFRAFDDAFDKFVGD